MNDRYRVPKRRVQVELRMPRLGVSTVSVFLGDRAERHGGPERPSDLFNGCDFLPVENEQGRILVLNCERVALVGVPAAEEDDKELVASEPPEPDDGTQVALSVLLEDGSVLRGQARYRLPEARSRVQDFLNGEPRFVPLRQDDRVFLVNKRCIVCVKPL